jgi:hypothetical protein
VKSSNEILKDNTQSTLPEFIQQTQMHQTSKGKTNNIRMPTSTQISSKVIDIAANNNDEDIVNTASYEIYQNKTECEFNPCQNNGVCLLLDEKRFVCSCKRYFFGVYCENSKHLILAVLFEFPNEFRKFKTYRQRFTILKRKIYRYSKSPNHTE